MNTTHINNPNFFHLQSPLKIYELTPATEYPYLAPHWHNEIELIFILKGNVTFCINSLPIHATSGDIIVINCNEIHSADYYDKSLQILNFSFNLSMFQSIIMDYTDINYIKPLIDGLYRINNIITYETSKEYKIGKSLLHIAYLYTLDTPLHNFKLKSTLLMLICSFFEYDLVSLKAIDKKSFKHIDDIKIVLNYINKNYYKKLTLAELATLINYNKDYLSRIFKNHTGVSCFDYITNVRIAQAKNLLEHTDFSISKISSTVGYDSQSYFITRFKSIYSMSPKTFRKTLTK